jgi:hypothetical protein
MSVSPSPSEHPPQIDLILGPPGGGELKPKDFSAVDPVSRENIYEEELGKHTHLNVQLHLAQFGVYDGEPAALLVFRFIFQYRSGRKRITAVSINAQFRTEGPEAIPYVVSLAPEQVNGEIFEEQCTHAVSGGVHLGAPYLGAGFQANTGGTFTRQHVLSLQGSRKSSDLKGAVYDRVVWDCEETRKKAKGIIPKYLGAVIVKCSGRFSATFDVDVTQASWLSNLQYKYETLIGRGESCPIVFDRARPFGDPVTDITDFKELDLDKLISEEPARLVLRAPPNNQEMLETPVQTGISPGNAQADTSTGEASDFPTTAYYNQVNALLLYWEEDDLGCKKEIDKVRETFENRFYYRTQTFVIPSQRSQANLQKALSDFVMETACSSGLTVIYYAGHGAPDNGSDERLSKLIWAA